MVIVRLSHGLGNQFFQYASARTLAQHHNVALALDLSWFEKDDSRSYGLDKFNIKATIFKPKVLSFLQSDLTARIDRFLGKNLLHHKLVTEPSGESIDMKSLAKSVTLKGYWGRNQYFFHNLDTIRKDLTIRSKYENQSYLLLKEKMTNANSVSVHIRRGDYLQDNENSFFGVMDKSYYVKAIDFITDRVSTPQFFIFTDDQEWVESEMSFPSNSVFVSKVLANTDYLEQSLMRYCKHNIVANSTFSWWGATLNSNEEKTVIQPKRWYKDEKAQSKYESGVILKTPNSIYL